MPDAPLLNSAEARSPDGTLLDQGTSPTNPPAQTQNTTLPTPDTAKPPSKASAEPTPSILDEVEPDPAKKDEEPPADPAAAQDYTDFTLPEGYEANAEVLNEAKTLFKEVGLNQEQAQKFVDLYGKQILAAIDAPYEAFSATRKGWRDAVAAEHGTEGLKAMKADIGRLYAAIGNEALVTEFRKAMSLTGAGDHPAFVSVFGQIAKALGEGQLTFGKGPSAHGQVPSGKSERPTLAQSMYPNLPSSGG